MVFPRYLLVFTLLVGLSQMSLSPTGARPAMAARELVAAAKFGRASDSLTGDSKGKKGDPPRPRPKPGPRDGGDDD